MFDVRPNASVTLALAGAALATAAILAGGLPARRAAQIDPLTALRHESHTASGNAYTVSMWVRRRFIALAFMATLPLCADKEMTALQIEVKNQDGKPVDRASVVVKFVQGRSKVKFGKKITTHWELRTNQMGAAKIPPIPQGKILVQVIAKGYQTYGQTHDVDVEEKTIEVKLNPPQSQFSAHQ